jgi:hypothetical protein
MLLGCHRDAFRADAMDSSSLLVCVDLEALEDVHHQQGDPGVLLGSGSHHQRRLGQLVDATLYDLGVEVAAGQRGRPH